MALRIVGRKSSINVRKVLWTCAELDLPFEHVEADAKLLARNPNGLVPVLIDGARVLWESNTICRYLAGREGRRDLLPQEPGARAAVEMWMDWQASDFNNSWRVAFQGLVRRSAEHQDAGAIERSVTTFNGMVAIVDTQLAGTGGYICGPRFCLADIPIGLTIHRWRSIPVDKPHLAHVERYYGRLCERPGFRRYGRDGGP